MQGLKGDTMLWVFGVLLALIATVLLYWQLRYPTHTYRYKLTVEVKTPEGTRSGYAVREITWRSGIHFAEGYTGFTKERGEAVIVKLPNNQTLLALLYNANPGATARFAFGKSNLSHDFDRSVIELERPVLRSAKWGESGYPRLIRFRDPLDPMSVERIDPTSLADTFGAGYALKRITAQITDEPVTDIISKHLSWFAELDGFEYSKDGPFHKKFPSAASGLIRQ